MRGFLSPSFLKRSHFSNMEREKIVVASLDDLAKVSEETLKPIIHHGEAFYVLDGDVRYEFFMKSEPDVEKE